VGAAARLGRNGQSQGRGTSYRERTPWPQGGYPEAARALTTPNDLGWVNPRGTARDRGVADRRSVGRLIGIVTMLVDISTFAVVTAKIAQFLVRAEAAADKRAPE